MADPITENANVPTPGEGEQQELSLREELAEQFEAAEKGEQRSDDAPRDKPTRERDEHGRFVPKQDSDTPGAEAAAMPAGATPTAAPQPTQAGVSPQQQQQHELKAPGSWRPDVREKWGTVDPEVRAEVVRREREFQQVLMQASGARQFADAFERVVAPYQLFIRAENSTPLQAVDNLMQTAAILRTGNRQQRCEVVGTIIKQWLSSEADLQALDDYLVGHGAQRGNGQAAQQTEFRDPRVDMILRQQQEQAWYEHQATDQQMNQGIAAFAQQPGHEFFNDVRVTMGDLIDMAGRRGEILPMEQAYQRACQLDPNVSKILTQRASAQNASAQSQAALRARRAAGSVSGDSSLHEGATVPKDDSVRSALEAAFEAHADR